MAVLCLTAGKIKKDPKLDDFWQGVHAVEVVTPGDPAVKAAADEAKRRGVAIIGEEPVVYTDEVTPRPATVLDTMTPFSNRLLRGVAGV